MSELRVATPAEMVEAWEVGVMRGTVAWAKRQVSDHSPIPISDPTYHRHDNWRTDGGWNSARGISNPSAIHGMRGYLEARGLVAPNETEEAWGITLRSAEQIRRIEGAIQEAVASGREARADAATLARLVTTAMEQFLQ